MFGIRLFGEPRCTPCGRTLVSCICGTDRERRATSRTKVVNGRGREVKRVPSRMKNGK